MNSKKLPPDYKVFAAVEEDGVEKNYNNNNPVIEEQSED
jgi:hypothetical protein